jgi:hypothetical protein
MRCARIWNATAEFVAIAHLQRRLPAKPALPFAGGCQFKNQPATVASVRKLGRLPSNA